MFGKLDRDRLELVAHTGNVTLNRLDYLKRNSAVQSRDAPAGRAIADRRTWHVPDVRADPDFADLEITRTGQQRTLLCVPLLRKSELIGVIVMVRRQVQPFTDRQIALVETFADQAVIAIENARLFEAEQTRDEGAGAESLEYQTATAEVLELISRVHGDATPVFDAIVAIARRLCDVERATIHFLLPDGRLQPKASSGPPLQELEPGDPIVVDRRSMSGRAVLAGHTVQIDDIQADPEFTYLRSSSDRRRTMIGVPILRQGEVIGAIALSRSEVKRLTEREVALVETFADQAVIAIENARLFEAEQTRTKELQEALQQQTATAEVLKTISRSAFDLETVLTELVRSGVRLCEADFGHIRRRQGDAYIVAASFGLTPSQHEEFAALPSVPGRGSVPGRALLERRVVHFPDVLADPEFTRLELQKSIGFRAAVAVPLISNGRDRRRIEPPSPIARSV